MKQIRMRINAGTFHNIDDVKIGDILEVPRQVDESNAARYIALGYAEEVLGDVQTATPDEPPETTAVPAPRRRGRPPKVRPPQMMATTT